MHGAPRLPRPGLSPPRSELRVRAGRGGGGQAPGERATPAARPWNDGARARERESGGSAQARALAPPPPQLPPTPGSTLFLPAPFFSRGGRSPGAKPVGVTAPAQAQCFPPPPPLFTAAGRGWAGPCRASPPPALRPAAKR